MSHKQCNSMAAARGRARMLPVKTTPALETKAGDSAPQSRTDEAK